MPSELERLRDRVAELEGLLGITNEAIDLVPKSIVPMNVSPQWRHSHHAARKCIALLLARPVWPRYAIYDALYGHKPECDQPDPKIIDITLTCVRRALAFHGITLRHKWKAGWYLEESDKQKLRDLIAVLATTPQRQNAA